jgi:hypothetical protein
VAILELLFRIRIVVLALLAAAAIAAFWFALDGRAVPVGALFLTGLSLIVGATTAFLHLRHAGLAVVQALAPLPGLAAAGPFAAYQGLTLSGFLAIYALAYLIGSVLAGDIVRRLLLSSDKIAASKDALARAVAPWLLTILAVALVAAAWSIRNGATQGLGAAAVIAATVASVLLFVPFASSVLSYGETFFSDANRAGERRERLLRPAAAVLTPRWGTSVTGIVLVIATLAAFGAGPWLGRNEPIVLAGWFGGTGIVMLLSVLAIGRDWREALAAALSLSVLTLTGLWLEDRAAGHAGATIFVVTGTAVAAALFLSLTLSARARRYRLANESEEVARLRVVEDIGVAAWFGSLGAAGAIAPWIVLHGSIVMFAVQFPLAGAAALVFAPAVATAIHRIVPRRRSLSELYGRG